MTKKNNKNAIIATVIILLAAGISYYLYLETATTTPKIYVANEGDGTISVIDAEKLRVIKTIHLDGMPHNVNVDPLGRYVYATNHEEEENEGIDHHGGHVPYLRIIDAKNNELIKSIQMPDMAAHAVPSRDGNSVYVSIEGGAIIAEILLETFTITKTFQTGQGPHGFVISNDGKTLYAPNTKTNDLSVINTATGQEIRMMLTLDGTVCEHPVAAGITADDASVFVTCGKSFEIYKIDTKIQKPVKRTKLTKGTFPGPIQIPIYPNSEYVYVPDMYNGVVHKIRQDTLDVVENIKTGEGSHGIAYAQNGKTAYVTNTYENTVSVIDLEKSLIIKKIQVGKKPNGIAVTNGINQGW